MLATEACAIVARHRGDALVVVTMTTIFAFPDAGDDALTLRCAPLMGGASPIGLGVALARPDRRVIVCDGDGSLLMQLGSLATIAGAAPANLVHLVFHNGVLYEGGGRLPVAGNVDFVAVALAAGYASAHSIDTTDKLDALLPTILESRGPSLVRLQIDVPQSPGWSNDNPHGELPDWWFVQMGDDARAMAAALQAR